MTGMRMRLDENTALALDWLDLDEEIRERQDRKAKIGAMLMLKLSADGEVRMPSGAGVRLMAPRQMFDPELARKVLPPDLLESISDTAPSAKLAAAKLPPALLALCRKASGEPFLRRL